MNDTSYKIDPPKSSKGGSLKRNGYFRSKIATALMGKILLRILHILSVLKDFVDEKGEFHAVFVPHLCTNQYSI